MTDLGTIVLNLVTCHGKTKASKLAEGDIKHSEMDRVKSALEYLRC